MSYLCFYLRQPLVCLQEDDYDVILQHNNTPGIRSMPKGYIVLHSVRHPFVCPFFRLFICQSFYHPSVIRPLTPAITKVFFIMYISAATYQKLFIFGMGVLERILLHSTSMDPWVMPRGGARGENLGCLNKVVYCYNQVLL